MKEVIGGEIILPGRFVCTLSTVFGKTSQQIALELEELKKKPEYHVYMAKKKAFAEKYGSQIRS